MRDDRVSSFARRALIVVASFNVLSAAVGAAALVTVGLPIPLESIRPFRSFLIPGLLLGVVIGGTQLWSLITEWRRAALRSLASTVAGFGMTIWIVVEVAILGDFVLLHAIYLGSGLLQIGLVLLDLGVLRRR